jgi:hypothetical protein
VGSKRRITRLLPNDHPRTLAIACGVGAAASSCSYAAVALALARAIFRMGVSFTAAVLSHGICSGGEAVTCTEQIQ